MWFGKLTRVNGNNEGNVIFITATGIVHVSNWVLFLVTITFLDLLMIH